MSMYKDKFYICVAEIIKSNAQLYTLIYITSLPILKNWHMGL